MDNESNGQHIIFVFILALILFLSYCSIPSTATVKSIHKTSKKAQTKNSLYIKKNIQPETGNAPSEDSPVSPDKTKVEGKKPEEQKPEEQNVEEQNVEEQNVEAAIEKGEIISQIDIIPMNNPLYKSHKRGIVQFTHKEHVEKYLIACGSCHHDETGKPLDLTFKDTPKGCIDCHQETEKPKDEKLGKKEKIAKYHFEALHANCIGCHKDYNKKEGDAKGKGPAPTSCTKCHPKEQV